MGHRKKLILALALILACLALGACGAYGEEEEMPRGTADYATATTSATDTVVASVSPDAGGTVGQPVDVRTVADCIAEWNKVKNAANQEQIAELGGNNLGAYIEISASDSLEATQIDEGEDEAPPNYIPLAAKEECVAFFRVEWLDDVGVLRDPRPTPLMTFVFYRDGVWRDSTGEPRVSVFTPRVEPSEEGLPTKFVLIGSNASVESDGTLRPNDVRLNDEKLDSNASEAPELGLFGDASTEEECVASWNSPNNAHKSAIAEGAHYRVATVSLMHWFVLTLGGTEAAAETGATDRGISCRIAFFDQAWNSLEFSRQRIGGVGELTWVLQGPWNLLPEGVEPVTNAVVQPDGTLTLRE